MPSQLRDQSVIVLREWKPVEGGSTPFDRIVNAAEKENYSPAPDVHGYRFRDMQPGSIRQPFYTGGRTLDGQVIEYGPVVLVGDLMRVEEYIFVSGFSQEQARNIRHGFSYEWMLDAVCVHPDGIMTEIRGGELLYNPKTKSLLDVDILKLPSYDW